MRMMNKLVGAVALLVALFGAVAAHAQVKDLGEPVAVVAFEGDSDELSPAAKKTLEGVRAAFVASGKKRIVIRGHSDPKEYTEEGATSAYGIGLSQRRSGNVRSQLWDKSLTEAATTFNNTMLTEAHGEALPRGKGSRRRVEIFFTDDTGW